jgi:hypothetical protein
MKIGLKICGSLFVLLIGIAVMFAKHGGMTYEKNDKWWSVGLLGFDISLWPLVCKPDGSFRKYAKLGIIIWLAFGVLAAWLLI